MQLGGLKLSSPDNFVLEESKWVLRAPVQEELSDPRLSTGKGKRLISVRPNLIIQRKAVADGFDLTEHIAQTMAELMQSIADLEEIVQADIDYTDGQVGKVAVVGFSPTEGVSLCQFHAYRLDDSMLTSMTWTIDAKAYNTDKQVECIAFLATVCPD